MTHHTTMASELRSARVTGLALLGGVEWCDTVGVKGLVLRRLEIGQGRLEIGLGRLKGQE